jgi:hypothetical protein
MGLDVLAFIAAIVAMLHGIFSSLVADEFKAWLPWITERVIRRAVRSLPAEQQQRYSEEWGSHLDQVPGAFAKLCVAFDLLWAGWKMSRISTGQASQLPEKLKSAKPGRIASLHIVFGTPVPRDDVTSLAILGANANSPCPKCGYRVAFFSGEPGAFMSELKQFTSDTLITLKCPIHGNFDVSAGAFENKQNESSTG